MIFSDATNGACFSQECDGGPERAVAKVLIECDDLANASGIDGCLVRLGINSDMWQQIGLDWKGQVEDALAFDGALTLGNVIFYILAVPWRLAFALAPPPRLAGGWACFLVALAFIGGMTALVGDYAGNLGCCLGISKSITAITFVALGTSLPDTFASMSAAQSEPHADNSLGNITGSNSVNVFLGLGLPWGMRRHLLVPPCKLRWRDRGRVARAVQWRGLVLCLNARRLHRARGQLRLLCQHLLRLCGRVPRDDLPKARRPWSF